MTSTLHRNSFEGPSFSFMNRLMRLVWGILWGILGRFSPTPFHAWRSFLLRIFGAKVGSGVHVYPRVRIWAPWNLDLGDQVGIANDVILYNQDLISVGTRSVISQGSHLCCGTHDYSKTGFPLVTKKIQLGSDVWIAAEAFVHPGVMIGDGVVIGARSVVTDNMPAWTVCSGNPCVPIKERIMGTRNDPVTPGHRENYP
jgi:putative colanic acid biosynthesis acetyltransferase WcaF